MGRTGIVLAVLFGAGCVGPKNDVLRWQLDYARAIPASGPRASALRSVGMSAAYVGDAAGVKAVLDELKGDPDFDDCAARCAVELMRGGHPDDARKVAKRVADPARRKEVFEALDKPAEPPASEPSPGPAAGPGGPPAGNTPPAP